MSAGASCQWEPRDRRACGLPPLRALGSHSYMPRFDLDDLWADDQPPPPWLIPGILTDMQMLVLAGDAGTGKTLLTCVWGMQLAAGQPIMGVQSDPVNVLYINEENSWYDMREYLRWARYGMPDLNEQTLKEHLRVEQHSLTLGSARWYETLRIIAQESQPRLIIIDTATPACAIQDEDKNGEASIAIGHLRRAQREAAPGCAMIVLKHSKVIGKGKERTIRGAKAWKGACDGLIFHTRTAGRKREDGLHSTYLWPDKARAFGLRNRLKITPEWTDKPGSKKRGILLRLFDAPEQEE